MVLFTDIFVFQMFVLILTQMIVLMVYARIKPFSDKSQYRLHIFDELGVILLMYHLICYTDFVPEPETQFKVGWSMVAITALLIIPVNLFVLCVSTYDGCKKF